MGDTLYTINEVEAETGISAFTIRYYDKCGFFNTIARNSQGRRRFSQENIDRLLLIDALKKSGLSIDGLKNLAPRLDDPTYRDDLILLLNQRLFDLDIQMEDLTNCQKRISRFLQMLTRPEQKENNSPDYFDYEIATNSQEQ